MQLRPKAPAPVKHPAAHPRRCPAGRSANRGVTLVELLVVVTVIVILLALLVPGLERGIAYAERLACMARMHNANAAIVQYAMGNKLVLPGFNWNNTPVDSGPWYDRLITHRYVSDAGYPNDWEAYPGSQPPGGHSPTRYDHPFVCPAKALNTEYILDNPTGAQGGAVPLFRGAMNPGHMPEWIAYNVWLGFNGGNDENDVGPYRRVKLTGIPQPSETINFTDGYRWGMQFLNNAWSPWKGNGSFFEGVKETQQNQSHLVKHEGGANYGFVGGNAQWMVADAALERANRGRSRTQSDGATEYFVLPFPHPRQTK